MTQLFDDKVYYNDNHHKANLLTRGKRSEMRS